jgi:hypothetical protein
MRLWIRLHNRRWFWRLRSAWGRSVFHIGRFLFASKERARTFREDATISGQLLAACRSSLIATVVTIALCEVAWQFLLAVAQRTQAGSVLAWATSTSTALGANGNTMDTLLSVIASVCGVFLALYFTAVSVVAQAGFASAPNAVKDLLLREKAGNLYMRILTTLTCVTLVLLGLHALGYQPSPVAIIATIIFGVLGIISFMALGLRAFYFFDPSRLANVVVSDFLRNASMATAKGFRWHDRTFQAHYHKLAVKDLNRAQNLVTLCLPTLNASAEASEAVLQNLTIMMGLYAKLKRRIPTDSHWYTQSPQHKNWFLQDHTALDMAIRTQTSIQPSMVADRSWVESLYLTMLAPTWTAMLKADAAAAVHGSLSVLSSHIEDLGGELEVTQAVAYIRSTREALDAHYSTRSEPEISKNLTVMAVMDTLAHATISLAVGFFKHFRSDGPGKMAAHLGVMTWHRGADIYGGAFPAALLPRIEHISRCVTFENQVEQRTVSPVWYLSRLAAIGYCDTLHVCFSAIIESFSDLASMAAEWNKRRGPAIAVMIGHRARELHFKIAGNLPHIRAAIDGLLASGSRGEPSSKLWDWVAFEKRIADIHASVITVLAQSLPELPMEKEVSDQPDFFGQTYDTVCQSCFAALRDNRVGAFSDIFPPVFASALKGFDALRLMLKDREPRQAVSWASEPLLDIIALSGYARLFADLHNSPSLWADCQNVWLKYLASQEDPHAVIQILVSCQNLRRGGLGLYPRDILRAKWETALNQALEEAGLVSRWDRFGSPEGPGARSVTPLLRAYCRGGHHGGTDATDVFIIAFLLRQPSAKGVEFRDALDFGSDLASEERGEEVRA